MAKTGKSNRGGVERGLVLSEAFQVWGEVPERGENCK